MGGDGEGVTYRFFVGGREREGGDYVNYCEMTGGYDPGCWDLLFAGWWEGGGCLCVCMVWSMRVWVWIFMRVGGCFCVCSGGRLRGERGGK